MRARDNPYSTDRVLRQRYRMSKAEWAELMERLRSLSFRGAIIGPHGSGKTTLLEDLAERVAASGWLPHILRLNTESPQLPAGRGVPWVRTLGPRDMIFLDGAEQLPLARWLAFRIAARAAGGLIITTHSAGRLPTLRRCATTPELLIELVSGLGQTLPPAEAVRLHRQFHGNIRDALRFLYDRAAAV